MDFSCPHGSIKLPFPSPQRNHSLEEHYGNLKQTKIKLEYCKPTYIQMRKRVASTQNGNNAFEKNDFWWL